MTSVRELWSGGVFVVEWDLVDVDAAPVVDADVAGVVSKPNGEPAEMLLEHTAGSNRYVMSFAAVAGGEYGYKLTATRGGAPAGATGGRFVVTPDVTGAPPIDTDPTTEVGLMRLLTTDVDAAFPILTDAQYRAFLTLEGNNLKRGAAAALEAIATSETMRSKKISTQDLSVDGPAVAADLRTRAKLLRDQADNEAPAGADQAAAFGFDFVDNSRTSRVWW